MPDAFKGFLTKSWWALVGGLAGFLIGYAGGHGIACVTPPQPLFPGAPTPPEPVGGWTTASGCEVYGGFLGFIPADQAMWWQGILGAVGGWIAQLIYENVTGKSGDILSSLGSWFAILD
jgi:hypothetical protein